MSFKRGLCDLMAKVSLMPLSVCKNLNLCEMKPTNTSLQLADMSVKYHVGVLENVPIRIVQLYIPTDFVIICVEEDYQIPIIIGRPFLAMIEVIIDVKRGRLTFEVRDEMIEFILEKLMKNPSLRDSYCLVDIINACVKNISSQSL